LALVLALE
jgi:hypothetical protein